MHIAYKVLNTEKLYLNILIITRELVELQRKLFA